MAFEREIVTVRELASVPFENLPVVEDTDLTELIAIKGINGTTAYFWTRYASSLSGLVNVSESGSSRSLGDLHKNALAMAKIYSDLADRELLLIAARPHTRAIVRP